MTPGRRHAVRLCLPLLCLPLSARAQTQQAPTFELTLERCPNSFAFPLDTPFTKEIGIYITTSDNPSGIGAQGWSLGVTVEGVEALSITTKGTLAALTTDEPPGLRHAGFEKTELARCTESKGAISAIVLSLIDNTTTLPPLGPAFVARLTVGGTAPAQPGERLDGRIRFQDSCRGSGKPVHNAITWQGNTTKPQFGVPCEFSVEGVLAPRFLRGDPNEDGEMDISDPLFILGCKFLGTACPGCRDAGDLNDDGAMDISDAIHGLNFLFSGTQPPGYPGPTACGSDPTVDLLPDCTYSRC